MSLAALPTAPTLPTEFRRLALAAMGGLIGLALIALGHRLIGGGASALPIALGLCAFAPSFALARLGGDRLVDALLKVETGYFAALVVALVARPAAEAISMLFGAVALAGASAATIRLAKTGCARRTLTASAAVIVGLGLLAATHALYYVAQSQDFMVADFMRNRLVSHVVAEKIREGEIAKLLGLVAGSLKEDYSWLPALPTGAAMALTTPSSRAVYQVAVSLAFVGPALFMLGRLSLALAARAGARPTRLPAGLSWAFAALAAFALYPTGVVVAARGMPDIFGLVFVTLALFHAEKLWRALAIPPGREAAVARIVDRLTLALCLDLFAMFAFRRWYIFAGAGVLATLALGLAARPLQNASFAWERALRAASLGALASLALSSPVVLFWLTNLDAHAYGDLYAAYRKPATVDAMRAIEWIGLVPTALASVGGYLLWRGGGDRRLLILALGSATVGTALFFSIQSPAAHHYYLATPALVGLASAPFLLSYGRNPPFAAALLAGYAALALTPSFAEKLPRGFMAPGGLPHAPRSDLDELRRLRAFVEERNRPDALVCGLGSSYTFSGQLIGELWQLAPERPPTGSGSRALSGVRMSDVDEVEGAPNPDMKNCATMIVGSPVQTHLVPEHQQTVIVPAREVLKGVGLGEHYRWTGEVFHLENGVEAMVYERTSPLTDADMAALAERWRKARLAGPAELRGVVDADNVSRSP